MAIIILCCFIRFEDKAVSWSKIAIFFITLLHNDPIENICALFFFHSRTMQIVVYEVV